MENILLTGVGNDLGVLEVEVEDGNGDEEDNNNEEERLDCAGRLPRSARSTRIDADGDFFMGN